MPGIDRQRVVGKTEDELDEFICSICQDILEEPVVTQCCRQSFCKVCINQWLSSNNTCPYDRKKLSVNQLSPLPRMYINLLNKLNIKCVNYGNGCQSIVRFEEMSNHMKTCNTCDSCNSLKKSLSDNKQTIDFLKNIIEGQESEVCDLKDQMNKLRHSNASEIDSLKNKIEGQESVIDDLKDQLRELRLSNVSEMSSKALKPLYIANSWNDLCKTAEDKNQKIVFPSNIRR